MKLPTLDQLNSSLRMALVTSLLESGMSMRSIAIILKLKHVHHASPAEKARAAQEWAEYVRKHLRVNVWFL